MISARGDLDDRVARRQDRQTAMLVRAQVRAAGALRAPGRALGRCGAIYAKPSHPAPDVTPAASGVLRLLPCGFGRAPGAPFTARAVIGGRRAALAALTGGTPRGILFPLAFTFRLAAGLADRAAFNGLLLCRNACTGQPPAVPGRAACSCYSRSCGTVPRRVRHKAYRRPWPSHTLRARPCAACHRSSGISCDPPRAGPLRILDTCRGQGARRCGGGSVPGRTRGRARGLCKPLAVSCRG